MGDGVSEYFGKNAYACTLMHYVLATFCVQGGGGGLKIMTLVRMYFMDGPLPCSIATYGEGHTLAIWGGPL